MTTYTPVPPAAASLGERRGAGTSGAPAAGAGPEALSAGGISPRETLGIALSSLKANKLRSLLTALGIIIGVATVVALMAIGQGSQQSITDTITANGANLLTVRSGASSAGGVRGAVGRGQTHADVANVPSASLVSPEYASFGQLVAGSQNTSAQVTGALPAYQAVHSVTVEAGAFIADDDVSSRANVVVLGANVAETLFPDGDALGQTIHIEGQRFTVVGVLAAKGGGGFGSTDDGVLVPLTTAQDELLGADALSSIAVQAADETSVEPALAEITATLRAQHDLPAVQSKVRIGFSQRGIAPLAPRLGRCARQDEEWILQRGIAPPAPYLRGIAPLAPHLWQCTHVDSGARRTTICVRC